MPEEIVKKSWEDVQKNMAFFQGLFGNANFLLVDNSKHLSVKEAEKKFKMLVEKGIDKFLKKDQNKDLELAAESLRMATRHLGSIVGKEDVEEILGSIFKDFCIGK